MSMSTVYLLTGLTESAREWIEENIHHESYQIYAGGIAISHRYIEEIVDAMLAEGFELDKDFTIN